MASLWDEGDIAKAVTKAKNLGAVFIVFVEGNNELSSHYDDLFKNEEILQKLNTKHFVAIKVQENSTAHQQFSAIYPHTAIPSIFFIGKNGKPLEVLSDSIPTQDFQMKIDCILEKAGISQADLSSSIIKEERKSEPTAEKNVPTTSGEIANSLTEDKVSSEPSNEVSPEKKIQHAKELIEQMKEEKKKQEEEAERLREIDRRKIGQNVQQMKRKQQDEVLKQLVEERDREKRENQAARDRVLAQIAQDKAERAAKFSKPATASVPQLPQQVAHSSKSLPKSNSTKLQFRLPDGSVHTHEFQISDNLEIVHQYIQNEMNLPYTNYTISTSFPRREFTVSDNSQTLLDLQLVPNAVILVLPQNQGVVSTNNSGMVGNVFWWLIAPFVNIYDFLLTFIFGRAPTTSNSTVSTSGKRSASDMEESSRNVPKRQASDTTEIKKQGNIHRLRDRSDTDDDNNTWNGNSTQQM